MTFARDLANFADISANNLTFRNLVINGAMVVDQRNSGAAVTGQTTNFFAVDRFICTPNSSGIFTGQRVTTAPTGFNYSLKLTVTTARTSIAASDVYGIRHRIEGQNCMPLRFGNSDAKTVTLSFWVQSSITGTYAVSLFNASFNRSYVATYSISSANTWERKTITITGDTTGTWAIDNTLGIELFWDLGSGSTYNGTANTWAAAGYIRTSGTTNWISTNGATFLLTGVQLEIGSSASAYEFKPYDIELRQCQRYYWRFTATEGGTIIANGFANSATVASGQVQFPVSMRAVPTSIDSATVRFQNYGGGTYNMTSVAFNEASAFGAQVYGTISGATAGHVGKVTGQSTGSYIGLSAEL